MIPEFVALQTCHLVFLLLLGSFDNIFQLQDLDMKYQKFLYRKHHYNAALILPFDQMNVPAPNKLQQFNAFNTKKAFS